MLSRVARFSNKLKLSHLYLSTTATEVVESEYTETPQYPPILDNSFEKKLERKKETYYEEIKNVKTVEEKQIKLNMPRYFGFKCYMLLENRIPYNNLHFTQHLTRTHLIEQNDLPSYYNKMNIESVLPGLKSDIEEAVFLELEGYKKLHELTSDQPALTESEVENIISKNIVNQINRVLLNNLSPSCSHLMETQVDFEPRVESFWYAGGMDPPMSIKKRWEKIDYLKDKASEPTNRAMQYLGTPILTLRNDLPLPPVISKSEAENPDLKVPFFEYDPRTVGTYCIHRRLTNIPGFWPGESQQFGAISYNRRNHLLDKQYKDPSYTKDALHRQGILATFGWLNAQANNLGFTTFNDITYPLTTQCVISNGKLWSLYVYQLNTILIHTKHVYDNPKRNICWATDSLKLFEEIKDGKVIGFNDDLLKMLVKFYANRPQHPENIDNLRPFLSDNEKIIADYNDPEKREWLEREYKFIMSNRERYQAPYEIYHWEKIYKIDHNTRPMERRSRPFELLEDPWKRRYDDRLPKYIPRILRPDLPKKKGRYAKEYFP